MYYLIFVGDMFVGYTEDKETKKQFIKENEPVKFRVEKIKKLSKEFFENPDNQDYELSMDDYFGFISSEKILIEVGHACDDILGPLDEYYTRMEEFMRYLKFTPEEEKIVRKFLKFQGNLCADLFNDEDYDLVVFYDNYFNIPKLIREIVLNPSNNML